MIRRPHNPKYNMKAYLIERDTRHLFYCSQVVNKFVTEEIGQPMGNGSETYETDYQLDFTSQKEIEVGGKSLTIDNVTSTIDSKNQNARRGKPTYIHRITVS